MYGRITCTWKTQSSERALCESSVRRFRRRCVWGGTPVPIPNTKVKPRAADDTVLETVRESRWLPEPRKITKAVLIQETAVIIKRPEIETGGTGIYRPAWRRTFLLRGHMSRHLSSNRGL